MQDYSQLERFGVHYCHPTPFRFVEGSVTDEELMNSLVNGCDIIFHLAAAVGVSLIVRDPVRVIQTNVVGTSVVLKLANLYRKKVLIASTSEIYGKSDRVPFSEEDDRLLGSTSKFRWSYSTSKAVDEFLGLAYFRQMGLPVVVFRLFNTVGPRQSGQYGMVVPRFVQQALAGQPLTVYGDGRQSRCFCDVADSMRAIIGLAECPDAEGQVFNVGSIQETTILELAQNVLSTVGTYEAPGITGPGDQRHVVFVPYETAYESGFEDMQRRIPNIGKIKATIGWEPRVTLDESLRRIVAHFLDADGHEQTSGFSNRK